ncbi:MAG: heme lyase CcmF/NrfE family subunit [Alphaproteobacteria bacterium]|nr:heme lyase CcmF/NrfE family subunit [Alphaproteobacteria bacterium]
MAPELGHFALALALVLSIAQAALGLVGAAQPRGRGAVLMAGSASAALGQFLFATIAFFALMASYIASDFSVENVVQNSHSAKPLLYKISGTWGNHEGSMVLWCLILAMCGAAVALFGRQLPPTLKARVIGVLGLIGVGFLAFVLFTSNPFARIFPPPPDGRDLNPLLQDPGLAFHPPFLYLGYVGFSVSFAFAIAALIEGRVDAAWGRWVRPWTLAAWVALTLGIALGSWWAYYELGWGGFWFWDPVENASFMPWLLGTALLHSAVVVEKREALKVWTILLAILTFSLSLLGTFLVRSGVLNSVHAFANDPARGIFILLLLLLVVGGSLLLFAWRAPALRPQGFFAPISREGGLVLNNLLLATATATVFVGTLYPLFAELVLEAKISVGAPFFNAVFFPLMAPLVVAMAIGPLLPWKRGDLAAALSRLAAAAAATAFVALLYLWIAGSALLLPLLAFTLATWLAVGTATELSERIGLARLPWRESARRLVRLPRAALGMTVAHLGFAITLAGIGGMGLAEERIALMRPGETATLAGYAIRFEGIGNVAGPNYVAARATLAVSRDGRPLATLSPERRSFPVAAMSTSETAIRTTGFADLYAAVGESDANGATVIRLYHKPLAPWVWLGALVMALGGMLSLSDRRYRIGAPARRRREADSEAAAHGAAPAE